MFNSHLNRILKLAKRHYNPKLVTTWISIIEKDKGTCPCLKGGFINYNKFKPSVPKDKCPLDLFKGIDHCLACEFSHLWNSIARDRKKHYSPLLKGLKKIQKNN